MRGFFIGAGAILPGISSGVFCIIFGLYEKIISSILHFFCDIKRNICFLFPICIGTFLGIFIFANILKFVYSQFYMQTCFCFMGLIIGSIPAVYKQAAVSKISFLHILCLSFTFALSIYLISLESLSIATSIPISNCYLILCGIVISCGIVIPGISKTVILMVLGIYEIYLSSIASLNFALLLPIIIGLAIGSLIFLFLLQFLFANFKSYTYFAIIGFILSSVFVIYPGFSFNFTGIFSVFLFVISFLLSFLLISKQK